MNLTSSELFNSLSMSPVSTKEIFMPQAPHWRLLRRGFQRFLMLMLLMLSIASKRHLSSAPSYQGYKEKLANFPWDSLPWTGKRGRRGWNSWQTYAIISVSLSPWNIPRYHRSATDCPHVSPERDQPKEDLAPIAYCKLQSTHLPQVHDLLERSFLAGIDGKSACT